MCPAGLVSQCGSKLGQSVRRSQVTVDSLLQSVTVLVVIVVAPLGAFVDGECIGGLADLSLQDLVVGSLIGISRLIGDGFQRGKTLIKCQIIGKVLVGVEPLQELKSQILVLCVGGNGQTGTAQDSGTACRADRRGHDAELEAGDILHEGVMFQEPEK